jgi:hypothetical protein
MPIYTKLRNPVILTLLPESTVQGLTAFLKCLLSAL